MQNKRHNHLLPPSRLLTLPSGPKARSSISPSWALNSSTFSRLGTCSQTTTTVTTPGFPRERGDSRPLLFSRPIAADFAHYLPEPTFAFSQFWPCC